MVAVRFHWIIAIFVALATVACLRTAKPLFIAPLYVEYLSSSPDEFAQQARALKQTLGDSKSVRIGFSTFLEMRYGAAELNSPISRSVMQETLKDIDLIVDRARSNDLPVHISVVSGFF